VHCVSFARRDPDSVSALDCCCCLDVLEIVVIALEPAQLTTNNGLSCDPINSSKVATADSSDHQYTCMRSEMTCCIFQHVDYDLEKDNTVCLFDGLIARITAI